ncbi:hypothetical protein C0Z18_31765 [Trinickia dabaoshanensis]|uniref:Uncharacterized protein n=1 Tax=Trinickia dabaoshanensis TaxID=564714 RepID=A0A2N7VB66_9BURK|nr:hypothetical protein C0Z18_31765 [Trinickia dabaoshanensis]
MFWKAFPLVALLAMPVAAQASLRDNAAYDDCMLQTLRESRNGDVTNLIRQSCDAIYRNGAMLLPRDRRYHECILQSLPGVRDEAAVEQIVSICRRRGGL